MIYTQSTHSIKSERQHSSQTLVQSSVFRSRDEFPRHNNAIIFSQGHRKQVQDARFDSLALALAGEALCVAHKGQLELLLGIERMAASRWGRVSVAALGLALSKLSPRSGSGALQELVRCRGVADPWACPAPSASWRRSTPLLLPQCRSWAARVLGLGLLWVLGWHLFWEAPKVGGPGLG